VVFGAKAHPPTRVPRPKAEGSVTMQPSRKRGRRRVVTSERDRGVRGSIASAPWEENAHARDQAVRHPSRGYVLHRDPPKRSSGVVKRSIPPVMPFGA